MLTQKQLPEGWELVCVRKCQAEVKSPSSTTKAPTSTSSSSLSSFVPCGAPLVLSSTKKIDSVSIRNRNPEKLQEREELVAENGSGAVEKEKEANVVNDADTVTKFDTQEPDSKPNPGENVENTDVVQTPVLEEEPNSNSVANTNKEKEAAEKLKMQKGSKIFLCFAVVVLVLTCTLILSAEPIEKKEVTVFYDGKNHTGDFWTLELTRWDIVNQKCLDLSRWTNDRISSIDTKNRCLRIYEHFNCQGRMAFIAPDTPSHWDLHYYNLDNAVSSIKFC